jgi:phytoene synthase
MCALYAFLRHTDDLADEAASVVSKTEAINAWRLDFDAALAGRQSQWPGLPAVADTIARHRIPAHLLHEVIAGVSMDVEPHRFATFADLAEYCFRVASVVGICCLHVWGFRSEGGTAEKLAEKCGIALQLTNIIRDVRGDACNGRIYSKRSARLDTTRKCASSCRWSHRSVGQSFLRSSERTAACLMRS